MEWIERRVRGLITGLGLPRSPVMQFVVGDNFRLPTTIVGVPTIHAFRNPHNEKTLQRGTIVPGTPKPTHVDSEVAGAIPEATRSCQLKCSRSPTHSSTISYLLRFSHHITCMLSTVPLHWFSNPRLRPYPNPLLHCGSSFHQSCHHIFHLKHPMEVVNRNPTFGSSLLSDNFGLRTTEDDMKALDPLHLEAACPAIASEGATETRASEERGPSPSGQSESPLLQSPDGATQMFNPVGAKQAESAAESQAGRTGMRTMVAKVTGGAEVGGVTDWNAGTDGGRSCKAQGGVPYGSFAGL